MHKFYVHKSCMRLFLTEVLTLGALAFAEIPRQMGVDRDAFALLQQDFVAFDPHCTEERESRVARTYSLARQMFDQEAEELYRRSGAARCFAGSLAASLSQRGIRLLGRTVSPRRA